MANMKGRFLLSKTEDEGCFHEPTSSLRSKYATLRQKTEQSSRKFVTDDINWFSHSIVDLEKSSYVGIERFWEGQWPCHDREWAALNICRESNDSHRLSLGRESCQSPSASESSSSLSTRESSSFSGKSETSSFAKRDLLPSNSVLSGQFSDFCSLQSNGSQWSFYMEKPDKTDKKPEHNTHQSATCRSRKPSRGGINSKFHETQIVRDQCVWQSMCGTGSHQDRQDSDSGHSRFFRDGAALGGAEAESGGLDGTELGTGVDAKKDCSLARTGQAYASLERSDEGWASDSGSSEVSWASAYSQEYYSEHPYDATLEIEDLECTNPLVESTPSHIACQIDADYQLADVGYPKPHPRSSTGDVGNTGTRTLYRESSKVSRTTNQGINSELRKSRALAGSGECEQFDVIKGIKFQAKDNEVLNDDSVLHISDSLHYNFEANANDSAIGTARTMSSKISSQGGIAVFNSSIDKEDWRPHNICAKSCTLAHSWGSTDEGLQEETYGTPLKAIDKGIPDACKNLHCIASREKLLNSSARVPGELTEPITNQLKLGGALAQGAPRADSIAKDRRLVGKSSCSDETLLSTSQTTVRSAGAETAGHAKPFPSVGLKSRHSAAVNNRYPSTPLHGYFRFVEQGGSPCYIFFVNDSDEVYFARACRSKQHSSKEDWDWLYTFHSKRDNGKLKGGWRDWGKKEKLDSDVVGKMKVSNARHLDAKRSGSRCARETEFVLFDEKVEPSLETQSSRVDCIPHQPTATTSPKPLQGGVASLPNVSGLSDAHMQHLQQRTKPKNPIKFACLSDGCSSDLHKSNPSKHRLEFSKDSRDMKSSKDKRRSISHMELGALVIRTSVEEEKSNGKKHVNPDVEGWGLKFLEKGSGNGWGFKFLEKNMVDNDRGLSASGQKPATKDGFAKLKVDVTVILPAGVHGQPRTDDSSGPTPLVEGWRSGGSCDCGGWDVGCGLCVLRSDLLTLHGFPENVSLTSHDRINWISPGNPLNLFTQGTRRKKVLGLEIIQAGFFALSFHARFSPLQAFATAVAILHQQLTQ